MNIIKKYIYILKIQFLEQHKNPVYKQNSHPLYITILFYFLLLRIQNVAIFKQ